MAVKGKRLKAIATELNVGVNTIVEFLHKKGYKIASNPNSKVPGEYYELLLKEFSSEKDMKKESEKLRARKNREKKETISIDDMDNEDEVAPDANQESEVFIKDISGNNVENVKTKKQTADKEEKSEEKSSFKVLGKINLETLEKEGEESTDVNKDKVEIEEKVVVEKQQQDTKEEVKEEIADKEKQLPKTEAETIIEEKTDHIETKEADKDKKINESDNQEIKEDKSLQDNTKEEKPLKPVDITDEKEVKHEQKDVENPTTEKGDGELKVVGKIDLDSLNQKTRPAKKTKKEKADFRKSGKNKDKIVDSEEKKTVNKVKSDDKKKTNKEFHKAKEVVKETTKKEDSEDVPKTDEEAEIFRTKVQQLSGPTVIGKIDLPDKKKSGKKKPVASSSDQNRKNKRKKRKRISKEPVSVNKKDGNQKDKQKKERHQSDGQERRKRPSRKSKRVQKKEVNEEDVQKQIKETLARLTAGKQKSKGSKHRRLKREQNIKKQKEEVELKEREKHTIKVTEFVSVNELANMMDVEVNQVISTCMNLGLFVGINQRLDAETIALISEEFNYEVEFISVEVQEAIKEEEDKEGELRPRAPIVTVMGHVDHGKTRLLDHIRNTNVIAGEAGGITQHIGAYRVILDDDRQITFLDTPGHQAFTAMRARGAQITDVVIIVVAADDNVMPQTVEAINHAQAAGVPIVFAINKIDKPTANPDKIKEELANMNFLVEEWGGKYQSQDISAKNGQFVDELLEKVLLEAEMLELEANPFKRAIGTVVEATLDRGRGYVATVLVQNGTLKVGDYLLAGVHTGRIKAMYNERNQRVESAGPGEPVLILGLDGAPQAGDRFNVLENEREAKEIANKREQLQREQGLRAQKHVTLDEIGRRIAIGGFQELNIIVKGDVIGTVEALSDSLIKLSTEQIQVNVIHKAVGEINENDVMLAAASDAIMVGFQVRPSVSARKLAETEGIDIRLYSIIYDAINEIKDAMEGMLSPDIKEEITGTAEILEVFKISKVGTVAGCIVRDGKIARTSKVRIIREGIVVYTGDLGSLKRFKDDIKEVKSGFECGLNIEKFNDIKVGDIVEAFEEVEVKRHL